MTLVCEEAVHALVRHATTVRHLLMKPYTGYSPRLPFKGDQRFKSSSLQWL